MNYLKIKLTTMFLIAGILFFQKSVSATHLLGGYMSYTYIRSTSTTEYYNVTVHAYRDCRADNDPSKKIPFDNAITICSYGAGDTFLQNYTANLVKSSYLQPVKLNNCTAGNYNCLEKAEYTVSVALPITDGPVRLVWLRCCKGYADNLIWDNGEPKQGSTWSCTIPVGEYQNNTPVFSDAPLAAICLSDSAIWKDSIYDMDGDSLDFKLVAPIQGATISMPIVDVCVKKYTQSPRVDYLNGFDENHLFGSNGYSLLDTQNANMQLFTTQTGYYTGCIEVTEFRKGVIINTGRYEFTVLADYPLDLKKMHAETPKIYPNPAAEKVHITLPSNVGGTWYLTDITGRKIMSGMTQLEYEIDVKNMASGEYFLKFEMGSFEVLPVIVYH